MKFRDSLLLLMVMASSSSAMAAQRDPDPGAGPADLSDEHDFDNPVPVVEPEVLHEDLRENLGSRSGQSLQEVHGAVAQCSPGLRQGTFRFHINDGYYYHRQRVAGGRTFLRCVMSRANPPCFIRGVMNNDFSGFTITYGQHNHGPDEWHDRVTQLRNSLLEACRARPNVRVDVIYHEVCRNVHRDVSSRVSLLSIRPSMVRVQAEHRPNIPVTFDELHNVLQNSVELRQSLDGQEVIYRGMIGAVGHRSLLFLSNRVVEGLGHINYVFADATFYSRPNNPPSAQLFTLVTMRDNHVIPVLHALMESRSGLAYQDLFRNFRQLAPNLDPEFLVTDFERALQEGLRAAFPRSRLTGCLWHFARAVCRRVRSTGLHALVRDVENARRVVRMSMAIPLAPADRIQEALNCIVVESRRLGLFQEFQDFFQYIRQTWIVAVGPRTLSVFGVRHRTNNVAECHHRNLNARLVRRPNIWRFLELLTENEDTSWRDLGRIEVGLAPSRARRVSSLMNDARIRSLSRQVINGEMDMVQFLSSTSWHLDSTMRDMLADREDADRPPSPERCPGMQSQQDRAFQGSVQLHSGRNQPNSMCPESDMDFQNQVFEPIVRQVSEDGGNELCLDEANYFEDLMEHNNLPMASGRGRGRGGRRGRGSRGGRAAGRGRRPIGASSDSQPPSVPQVHTFPSAAQPQPTLVQPPPAPPVQPRAAPLVRMNQLRLENFSDEEFIPDNVDDVQQRWQECIICNARVGHYTILGCGAFPFCGYCIRQWFIHQGQQNCPHCGALTPGWLRLQFQF